jgi:hypothetical protein
MVYFFKRVLDIFHIYPAKAEMICTYFVTYFFERLNIRVCICYLYRLSETAVRNDLRAISFSELNDL